MSPSDSATGRSRLLKELYPEAGVRPRQALLSMPRGNGKTGLAAVLAAYALFAEDVEGAQVLVVASDERQAGMSTDRSVG